MVTFWIVAAALIAVAVAFILLPLLRTRPRSGPTLREANLAVLRGQRQEIETDVALGVLPRDARESALAELTARADEDLAAAEAAFAPAKGRSWGVAAAFAIVIPAGAVAFYLWVGVPQAADPEKLAALAKASEEPSQHQIEEMVAALEAKMRDRPQDAEGWMLLARSYAATGKIQKAAEAYGRLVKLVPDDPNILADYADALGASRGRNLSGEPAELVQRALKIDPNHPKALALAGTAKLHSGDFAESIAYWERLYAAVTPGSPDQAQVREIIEDVRARAAAAGKPQPASKVLAAAPAGAAPLPPAAAGKAPHPPMGSPAPAAEAAAPVPGKSVSGTVKLASSLAAKISASDTLFVYARAETGSRIPLAILRGGAGELPKTFELDDSMGMSPAARLSAASSVVIEARVSKTGGAVAQPGDLVGTSAPVAPGAKGVMVVIDRAVP